MDFYQCSTCHQIYYKLTDSTKSLVCCDLPTTLLEENNYPEEKKMHEPHVRKTGKFITITIKQNHPMVDIHHIDFIALETTSGLFTKTLTIGDKPEVHFVLPTKDELISVYIHCNVHSLWKFNV